MTRTMVAQFAGVCADCKGDIRKGETIQYGGKGAATHETCRALAVTRYGIRQGYESTGSRCIDAPCCGCC